MLGGFARRIAALPMNGSTYTRCGGNIATSHGAILLLPPKYAIGGFIATSRGTAR
jgi:hypothetical protein